MSLISRLRAVVAGDDYLDGDFDELDYDMADDFDSGNESGREYSSGLASRSVPNPFDNPGASSNVIGMPGITTAIAEVSLMEPRSFDEMPKAIQALRERKTVILNLTMMEPDQAQRAVDFVAGGTFAIDGHQERVGESIFLFAPSCVSVTNTSHEDLSSPTSPSKESDSSTEVTSAAPPPAWGEAAVASV